MTDTASPAVPSAGFRLLLLWLIGVQLRLTVLAVPPVLPLIHRDLALSEKTIGLLSALPVLLLGIAAVPGSMVITRIGARRACILALTIIAVSSAARGIGPSTPMLFAMTLAMGAGVALLQPTLPSLVAEWLPHRAGMATAAYANGLLIAEAVPPAVTIPLILPWVGGSWEWSFVIWSIPVAVTALLLAQTTQPRPRTRLPRSDRWWPDWRDGLLWRLGFVLGGTGGCYFFANTFIPDYLHAIGRPELVGQCLSAVNIGQLPASALMFAFGRRLTGSRAILIISPLGAAAGFVAFFSATPVLLVAAAGLIGFCCGVQLVFSLAMPPLLARADDVHRLSAGTFAIGYFISFLVPPIGGAIWDATGIPATSFVAGGLSIVMVVAAAATMPPLRTAHAVSARHR
jgi:MFS transporter, CP family, cyanate transporter